MSITVPFSGSDSVKCTKLEQWFDSDWVVLSFGNSTLGCKDEMFTEFHSCSAIHKVFLFLEIIYIGKSTAFPRYYCYPSCKDEV